MVVAEDEGKSVQLHWRIQVTASDGKVYRVISSSQHVTDRIFKELSSLYKFHQKLFGDAADQELHLPLKFGEWSRGHRFAASDRK
jgi:hypothetical protein